MDISDWTRKLADSPLWQAYRTWRHPSMVCVVLAGRLYGVELQEGRFLRQGSAVLPDMTEEAVATAFRRLEAEGLTRKNVVLLVNFPKLRLLRRKYPAMTKEELEETMYWEEDRLFRTEEPLSLGYEIMDSGPEGWDVHVEAVPKETLALFEKGARDGGKEISSAIPVTAVPLEDGCFALYGRRRSAILTFRKGKIMESRILRREDQGKAALFLDHVKETWGAGGGKSYFLPMADCGEEERTFWKDWLRKDLAEAGNPEALAFVDSPFREGPSLWQDLAPLWPALDRAALELPLSEKRKPFLSEETKYLRLAEGGLPSRRPVPPGIWRTAPFRGGGSGKPQGGKPPPGAAEGRNGAGRAGQKTGTGFAGPAEGAGPAGREMGTAPCVPGGIPASGHCDFGN